MHASLVTFVFFVVSAAPSLSAPISEVQERYLCGDGTPLGPCPPARPLNPNESPLLQIEDKRSINGIQLLPGETNPFFPDETVHSKRFACGPGTGIPTCPVFPPDPLGLRAGETYAKRSINGIQLLPGETDPFFPEETTHSKRFACGDDIGFPCPELHLPPGVLASKRTAMKRKTCGPNTPIPVCPVYTPNPLMKIPVFIDKRSINGLQLLPGEINPFFPEETTHSKRSIAEIQDLLKGPASLGPGGIGSVSNDKRSIASIPKLISKMPWHISPPIGSIGGADTNMGLSGDESGSDNERRSFVGTAKSILDGNLYGVGMTV
ncbi:hypothetical protein PENSPDRAFT_689784 [Peniophora sp. CONT]|nr:hypothetical protein PENSPDRAFT_689784 [Peniophora sp. CONT]